MSLKSLRFVYIDCQTTGMRPPRAHVLEMAWSLSRACDAERAIHAHLVQIPTEASIPPRVSEMTGIVREHLTRAITVDDLRERLRPDYAAAEAAVIHYAQFEKPFLLELLGELPRPLICTYNLTKRLFPNLPRQNIRATAGFFGPPVVGHNRAGVFVQATVQIWCGLVAELERQGITDLSGLETFLKGTKRTKVTRYEYRLDKAKRLELPTCPGVYRMLGQTGEVLYVGKATSLRDRVNSYFRGQKNRDQRKLEMLAQVWDLRVTECATPLEAALLESDEIKHHNPPYNVVLKTGRRHLIFYDRDFHRASSTQTMTNKIGPFRNHNWIEHLRVLEACVASQIFGGIFFDEIPAEIQRAGYGLFLEQQNLAALTFVRQFLAVGLKLHRARLSEVPVEDEDEAVAAAEIDGDEAHVFTVEEVAGKFTRLFRRAGTEYARARQLTRLLNARVALGERVLAFRAGRLVDLGKEATPVERTPPASASSLPWNGLDVDTFDRMSIVRSALEFSGARLQI